jgi:hypothetical protein
MKRNRSRILLAAAFFICSLVIGYAYNSYMNAFNDTYPASPFVDNCNVCHTGGSNLNSYASDFASHSHSLTAVADLDSDGDGFSNLVEINAGTFPGDPQSTPADELPPTVALTLPSTTTSLTVTIGVSATDNIGVTGYMVNESAAAPGANASGWSASAPTSYTFSGAGNRMLYAWAKDAAGNIGGQSKSIVITLPDNTPPAVTLTMPSTATSLTVTIGVSATDNIGVTGYMVNESPVVPAANTSGWTASAPTSYSFGSAGNKMLYAWAKDGAGNVGGQSKPVAIAIPDSIPPVVTEFRVPVTSTSLTVRITSFNATDNVGVAGYMVTESSTTPAANSTGWASLAPASYTFQTPGEKVLYAWAKDAAGNVSTEKSSSITIDSTVQNLSGMTVWQEKWFRLKMRNPDDKNFQIGYLNILSWDEGNQALHAIIYTRDKAEQWQPADLVLHYASGSSEQFIGWFDYAGELAFLFRMAGMVDSHDNLKQAMISAVGLAQIDYDNLSESETNQEFRLIGTLVSLTRIPSGIADPEGGSGGIEFGDELPRKMQKTRKEGFAR